MIFKAQYYLNKNPSSHWFATLCHTQKCNQCIPLLEYYIILVKYIRNFEEFLFLREFKKKIGDKLA